MDFTFEEILDFYHRIQNLEEYYYADREEEVKADPDYLSCAKNNQYYYYFQEEEEEAADLHHTASRAALALDYPSRSAVKGYYCATQEEVEAKRTCFFVDDDNNHHYYLPQEEEEEEVIHHAAPRSTVENFYYPAVESALGGIKNYSFGGGGDIKNYYYDSHDEVEAAELRVFLRVRQPQF